MSIEFFSLYEKHGEKEFLKKKLYKQTKFWLTISEGKKTLKSKLIGLIRPDFADKKRILPILQMFKNMKVIKNLVPNSLEPNVKYYVFHPEDFPWSINYFGYIKRRDGSHRRMIMKYFGAENVDEIVVDFDKITSVDLEEAIPYLRDNFEWFYNHVLNSSREITPE